MRNRISVRAARTLAMLAILAMVGCLPYSLGDPEKSQIDPKLSGYWVSASDDQKEVVALFPFDQHTYVVEDVKLKKQDDKWQPDGAPQIFKGWLTNVRGQQFMTLDFLQQHLPSSTDQKVYPVLRLTPTPEGMLVRMVKSDFEPMKNVKSSAEVQQLIEKELDNPDLYTGDGGKFRRLDPDTDKETIQLVTPG